MTLGWLVYYAGDPAAVGLFRDNITIGTIGMVVLNILLARFMQYLTPKRRRM